MKPLFVFDLDSTITSCELLPEIAGSMGLEAEMAQLTERAMCGEVPFAASFEMRVALLKGVPVSHARRIAAAVPLNEQIARFLRENASRCRILTGNLDAWIEPLVERLGMRGRCQCSEAIVDGDRLTGVKSILDKEMAAKRLPHPFVAIGDGDNDVGLLREADTGIGFAGVRKINERIRECADLIFDDEAALVAYLQKLV